MDFFMRLDGLNRTPWRTDLSAKARFLSSFPIYMEVCVSTLHPLHLFSQNVIQRSGATKNLVYIKEWVFPRSFASLWMTIKGNVKNPPFHRKVNRVKGLGANFNVYRIFAENRQNSEKLFVATDKNVIFALSVNIKRWKNCLKSHMQR